MSESVARDAYKANRGIPGLAIAYLSEHGYEDEDINSLSRKLRSTWKRMGLASRKYVDVAEELIVEILCAEKGDFGDIKNLKTAEIIRAVNREIPHFNLTENRAVPILRGLESGFRPNSTYVSANLIKVPARVGRGNDVFTNATKVAPMRQRLKED